MDRASAGEDKLSKGQIAGLWALLFVLLFGIVTPVSLWIWEARAPEAAIRTAKIGTLVSTATSPGGLFAFTLTTVTTSESNVTVTGTFSAMRGSPLEIRDLSKHGLHLCIVDSPDSCVPLAGGWSGDMHSTPDATRVFHFRARGLTSDKFGVWVAMGIFIFLTGFVVFSASVLEGERQSRCRERVTNN